MATLVRCDGIGVPTDTVMTPETMGDGDTIPLQVDGTVTKRTTTEFPDCFEPVYPSGGLPSRILWRLGEGIPDAGFRYYFRKTGAHPGNHMDMLSGYDTETTESFWSSAVSGAFGPGQIRLYSRDSSPLSSGQDVWSLGGWYRAEGWLSTSGRCRFLLYEGHSLTPLYDSGVNTGEDYGTGYDGVRFGMPDAPSSDGEGLLVAHLQVTDETDTLIGPHQQPTGATVSVKLADGTVAPATAVSVWDGTVKQPATFRMG